ncbi:M23 family metallopeptidase [Enterococcus thailandicus]|uniref:M23 family metallopeptidase n=1 Tax=Enterococcus thailandicus TaxID=417368 RepID=UPI0022EC0706|nr:peptidoglycan DD-metalloendopeptidase family protein [Enterococcus thailandicus]MDA3964926.1 peptidoglycan DD-metalloendopeptidase family protein [Enterococcus thailandicus]
MGVWRLPFDGSLKSYEEGQQFGNTSYPRGRGYFHDGYDFGSAKYSGDFKSVNDGKVIFAGYVSQEIEYAIVLQIADYQVMYQEFGSTIYVKTGDQVKVGHDLGKLTTTHLHLGITKQDWRTALGSWDIDNGTWINPIPILLSGDSTDNLTPEEEEEMIKFTVVDGMYKGTKGYLYNGRFIVGGNTGDYATVYNKLKLMESQGKIKPITDDISNAEYEKLINVFPSYKNSK